MKVTFIEHAREKMQERGISEEETLAVLESPTYIYPGIQKRRFIAERKLIGRRKTIKVVYNKENDEYVVVTVMLGRPRRRP